MPPRRPDPPRDLDRAGHDRGDLNRMDGDTDEDEELAPPSGSGPFPVVVIAGLVVLGLLATAYELFGLEPNDLGGPTSLAVGGALLGAVLMSTLKR